MTINDILLKRILKALKINYFLIKKNGLTIEIIKKGSEEVIINLNLIIKLITDWETTK